MMTNKGSSSLSDRYATMDKRRASIRWHFDLEAIRMLLSWVSGESPTAHEELQGKIERHLNLRVFLDARDSQRKILIKGSYSDMLSESNIHGEVAGLKNLLERLGYTPVSLTILQDLGSPTIFRAECENIRREKR